MERLHLLQKLILAGGTAASLFTGGQPAAAQESVKIGVILPMTGPFQSTGWQANAAVNLFLKQAQEI